MLNAGGPPPGDFAHTTVDQYLDALELNCRGAIAMCYEAVPAMQEQQWGRVVAITSIAVRQPIPNLILSNTARAGLTGFLRTLAREVAHDQVTVNSLLPGLHATERIAALHGSADATRGGRARGDDRRSGRLRARRRVRLLGARALPDRNGDPGRRRRLRSAAVIRHIALLTFVEDTTDEQVRAVRDALATLPARLPQLRSYAIGPDLGINAGNASFAVVAEFATVDDYFAYRDDGEHRRIIAEVIAPILAARTGAQYEIPDAPNPGVHDHA